MHIRSVTSTIATVLLLVITVIGCVLTYAFVKHFATSKESNPQPGELNKMIKVEGVKVFDINEQNYSLHIYVRNIGKTKIIINAIYVLKPDGTCLSYRVIKPTKVKPGELTIVATSIPKVMYKSLRERKLKLWLEEP